VTAEPVRILRWETPPPTQRPWSGGRRPGSRFDQVAATLRDEPGRWALIYEGARVQAHGIAATVTQAKLRCLQPAGSFQVATRTHQGVTSVYVRHIGETA
jgi:hypothetical protein